MKMNKKGFTLIELLAVIVILAIIALIATPIIMGIIDDARTNAAMNSAYGYLDAVDKAAVKSGFGTTGDPSTANFVTLNGTYTISSSATELRNTTTKVLDVAFKGTVPTESGTSLTYTSGALTGGTIVVNSKTFTIGSDGKLSLAN
ncbi:MAG: prepilin-type N-terminal cleavage/methylation domain-containing protein [Bacilli bacterium]|nr:prepilin-type N-terminal cleavage/methylation domain-containing protein [Bacilli bacterium]